MISPSALYCVPLASSSRIPRIAHAYLDLRERTLVSGEKNGPHVCDVYVDAGWCIGLYVAGGVSKFA
jgi:hypothetical protein